MIRRIGCGLYVCPRLSRLLGREIPPDVEQVARALARKTGSRVIPSGAVAANWLGLSTQVPAQHIYLTDGRSKKLHLGNTIISLKHVAPRSFPVGRPRSAMVLQALRYLGKTAMDARVIDLLRRTLSASDKQRLLGDARYTTDWIADVVHRVVASREPTHEIGVHG